jgi:predicted esterase
MSTTLSSRLAVLALGALAACADSTPLAPDSTPDAALRVTSVTTPTSGPWARIVEGRTGPASVYTIFTPRTWNGDAIVYLHGFRDVASPVDLRDQDQFFEMRDLLGALGYAFAYSSFDANGFVVKNGAQRTHQLSGLLAAELGGQPDRTFLAGHSLGGGIALSLVEQFPSQYDGALLMCGMVGGSLLETQYLGHVRALFDFFYPGALPGDVVNVPTNTVVTLPQVIAAVQTNPLGLVAIASTAQAPLPFVPFGDVTDPSSLASQTLVGSLFGALAFQVRGAANLLELTHGHTPFDNSTTQYTLGAPVLPASVVSPLIAAANAGVARYSFDPPAQNYLQHHFTPTGDLQIPVLTVHNTWDPGVPAFHEAALLQAVQAAGATDLLLQRFVPSYGHCNIPAAFAVQAFTDLATWVATGNKPAS